MKSRLSLFVLLALTIAVLFTIVSVFPYEYRDSDSSCYSALSQKLALRPYGQWCAPQWGGHGGNEGLFREHPPGIFWLPALLVQAGIKPNVAALCANFIYWLLSLFLIFKLAERLGDSLLGWGMVFGIVLTPVFLQYLIRANQEHPLNLAILAGIYGLSRCRDSKWGGVLFAAALIFAVMIKGVSAILLSMLAVLFWLVLSRNRKTFIWIVAGHLLALGAAGLLELWYRRVTGEAFWPVYFSIQGARSLAGSFNPLTKAYNFVWYAARVLWFAAPWTFFLIYDRMFSKKRKQAVSGDSFVKYFLLAALVIIAFFSLSDRKADRYIFPAYFFAALAGLFVFFGLRPKIRELFEKWERRLPVVLSLTLIALTFLRIFFHSRLYKFVRFWPQ